MFRGYVTDYNNTIKFGIYIAKNTSVNGPWNDWSLLCNISEPPYTIQFNYGLNNKVINVRSSINRGESWSDWLRIQTTSV